MILFLIWKDYIWRNIKIIIFFFHIADRDDVLRYAERLSMRCSTVDVLVTVQRDHVQQEALHQVSEVFGDHIVWKYKFLMSD